MKEHPILFSAPMVCAILAGDKTQTRRLVKPQPEHFPDGEPTARFLEAHAKPRWSAGDRLWVKETFKRNTNMAGERVTYRADNLQRYIDEKDLPKENGRGGVAIADDNHWRPSIFMPRWASRITLEIVNVRVERLNSISGSDAEAEGTAHAVAEGEIMPATIAYRLLWNSINGRGSWEKNPWVWVIRFLPVI